MADDERERAIQALIPHPRPPRTPRWLWIVALVIGAGCAIAFVIAMVRGGDASSTGPAPATTSRGGFATGLLIGAIAGVVAGWFAHAHSSRSKP